MSDQRRSFLERVRKPEYTGENRCLPCTTVNAVIALLASAAVAAVVTVELGAVVLVCTALAIALRGYLVPGTPELTKRYLPERVLALFDHHPREEAEPTWETLERLEERRENAVDPDRFLREAGAVAPRAEGDGERVTDEFAALVERGVARHRDEPVDRTVLADVFDVDPDEVSVEDRAYPAARVGRRIRKWPGEAAFVADVATHEALDELTDRWADVPPEQRREILESLRALHETCPLCGEAVRLGEDTVESCCRSYDVRTLGCTGCGEPLIEFDPDAVADLEVDTGVRP